MIPKLKSYIDSVPSTPKGIAVKVIGTVGVTIITTVASIYTEKLARKILDDDKEKEIKDPVMEHAAEAVLNK